MLRTSSESTPMHVSTLDMIFFLETDGPMLKHGIQEIEGGGLVLPRRAAAKPNREFLAKRFRAA
jgi:putative restriction endonuclease